MPRALVQTLIEVIDACVEGIPFVPLDEANMQARSWTWVNGSTLGTYAKYLS